jgi:hypothetical protein
MCSSTCDAMTSLLAPLDRGDRLPWRLDGNGEPLWLIVAEVISSTS